MPKYKVSAVLQHHLCSVIGRAVIYDDDLDTLDTFQMPGKVIQHFR